MSGYQPLDGESQHATGKDAFPDRPNHPDFWKLSRIAISNDAAIDGGTPIGSYIGGFVDLESVTYLARHRAARLSTDPVIFSKLVAMFLDGFVTGVRF